MERRARRSIPRNWHRATLPVPSAYSLVSFVDLLTHHLSATWPEGDWAWSPGQRGRGEIVLATADIGGLPVLLAHVLVLTHPDSQPHARAQSAATVREILRQPYGWAAGLSQSIVLFERLEAPPRKPAEPRKGVNGHNGHANGHSLGRNPVEDESDQSKD